MAHRSVSWSKEVEDHHAVTQDDDDYFYDDNNNNNNDNNNADDYFDDYFDQEDEQQAPAPAKRKPPPANSNQLCCPNCGSTDAIEQHGASGASICTECGVVVEENMIVNSVDFMEGAGGSASVVGQFVSATSTKARGGGGARGGRRYGYTRESREQTLVHARRRLQDVASRLRLGTSTVDAAHRLYVIALERNFVMGRKSSHVTAACLYIACRQQKSQHMLIDFSDALQVNVYALGSCFLKFRRLLGLKLELIDPALYIYRFAAHLELDDKANAVALTALRLVARMKRDWIQTGRRPAGICAAALLIAARAHGFEKHHSNVTKILRVCGMTVNARVREFELTASAQLTLEQFGDDKHDFHQEHDPPAFSRNKLYEARAKAIQEGDVALLQSGVLDDPRLMKDKTRWRNVMTLNRKNDRFRNVYQDLEKELLGTTSIENDIPLLENHEESDGSSEEEQNQREEEDAQGNPKEDVQQEEWQPDLGADEENADKEEKSEDRVAENDEAAAAEMEPIKANRMDDANPVNDNQEEEELRDERRQARRRAKRSLESNANKQAKRAGVIRARRQGAMDLAMQQLVVHKGTDMVPKTIPTGGVLTVATPLPAAWKQAYPSSRYGKAMVLPNQATEEEQRPSTVAVEAKISLAEWKVDLPEDVDKEIESMFRSEDEEKQKEAIFNKINADYIIQQHAKEQERLIAESQEGNDGDENDPTSKPKTRKYKTRSGGQQDGSTEEQLLAAVSNRKVSRKINYDALSSIFDEDGSFSTAVPEAEQPSDVGDASFPMFGDDDVGGDDDDDAEDLVMI